jgi:uncharacterized membrane protein
LDLFVRDKIFRRDFPLLIEYQMIKCLGNGVLFMDIFIFIAFIILLGSLFTIEAGLRRLNKSNNEIVELLKEIKKESKERVCL